MTDEYDEELTTGKAIRMLRHREGISARSLSHKSGLSQSYIGKVERGEIELSLRAFARIAVQLGLTAREIHLLVVREGQRE